MSSRKTQMVQGSAHSVNLLDHRASVKVRPSYESHDILSAEERFDLAVIEYYASKGAESDTRSLDAIVGHALQSEKMAKNILSMPAITMRHVMEKLSILDAELLADLDCEAPVDRRHIVAFAALKVDIVRLLADKKE